MLISGPATAHRASERHQTIAIISRLIDHQHCGRALLLGCRDLVLKGSQLRKAPTLAPIQRLASQHQHHVSRNVEIGVVVVVAIFADQTIPDEHHLAVERFIGGKRKRDVITFAIGRNGNAGEGELVVVG